VGTLSEGPRLCAVVRFSKRGPLRYVGHLDLARAFDRMVRRGNLPVAYTEGFNPRAKIAFASPLPLGAESEGELCVMDLAQPAEAEDLAKELCRQAPVGLEVLDVSVRRRGRRSPLADLSRADYALTVALDGATEEDVAAAVARLLASPSLEALRRTKSGEQWADIRPGILGLEYPAPDPLTLRVAVGLGDGPTAKVDEGVSAINRELGVDGAVTVVRLTRTSLA